MESSLNVLCAICSEFFRSTDVIYSTTKCGHVFHQRCLLRWLSRSHSCPQCRANCHRHMVHQLYLNFTEPTPMDEMELEPVKSFEWFHFDPERNSEDLSKFAFKLDNDKDGDPIYAARVYLQDDLLPAYYVPKKKGVYCAWNCVSHFLTEGIELLHIDNDDAEYKWVSAENGEIPEKALATGYDESGESLYTGRTLLEGRLRYGKVHPSHSCCYVPYKTEEKNKGSYEVLVRIPKTVENEKGT